MRGRGMKFEKPRFDIKAHPTYVPGGIDVKDVEIKRDGDDYTFVNSKGKVVGSVDARTFEDIPGDCFTKLGENSGWY